MTRAEQKYIKECKEKQFIELIKGQKIDGKTKGKFRLTEMWKNFRKFMQGKYKVDYLTHRKLKRGWNLHHADFSSENYSILDENKFFCLNKESHSNLHWLISEQIKDPTFMKRINELVEFHIKLNEGKDIKDFLKD